MSEPHSSCKFIGQGTSGHGQGLRPWGIEPPARRLFCRKKYPWPNTTDLVLPRIRSRACARRTGEGTRPYVFIAGEMNDSDLSAIGSRLTVEVTAVFATQLKRSFTAT